jgi:phage tail-like protein
LPRGLAITSRGRVFLADPAAHVIWTARVDEASAPKPQDAPDNWPFRPLWPARPLAEAVPHDLAPPAEVPADPYTLLGPTDVAMAPNGDLVILDPAAHRILVMAFPTAVLRHVIHLEGGAPTAIAFDRHDRAYIADPSLKTVHRYDRNWHRDAGFSPVLTATPDVPSAPFFIAARGEEGGCGCSGNACVCASELQCGPREPEKPVVYTLDGISKLHAIYADGRMEVVADHDALSLRPKALILAGNGALLYHDPALPHHDPIRIKGLELTGDGRHAGTGLPLLARPRRVEVPRSGHFITDALDAGVPGFPWDRIALTLDMPENTRLILQTMTSDSAIEPDRVEAQPASAWSQPLVLTPRDLPEVLIQSTPGRHLWLRVDLSGDGTRTPVIHELDLFGPRRSALTDLPAPFHQDPDSARFLDRFLSYFDTIFAEITTRNRDIAMLFDPDTTPADDGFLAWLGSWFDLQFLADWEEGTRREMIREAITYFRKRGTVGGLRQIVQWHTGLSDPLPQIIEHFRLPAGPGAGPPLMIGGKLLDSGSPAHSFTVVLPASAMPDAASEQRLSALIAASIPAHCRFQIRGFTPGIAIGSQSSIGIDTLLGSLDPAGLGLGLLGGTFSTPGPEATGPVTVYANSQITSREGGYSC